MCIRCHDRAVNTYGHCDSCQTRRLLPGLGANGAPVCTDCAGGLGDFTCRRCGLEGPYYRTDACARCVLAERLTELLDDGTGSVRADLLPLFRLIHAMDWPKSRLLWLGRPGPAAVLSALGHADVPLTHEALNTLQPWRSVIYVRDLLVECGLLPPVDRFLFLFERWLPTWLASVDDPAHRALLTRFGTWHLLRRIRLKAQQQPINSYEINNARRTMRTASVFLAEFAERGCQHVECTQGDIDLWFAQRSHRTETARPFLRWCIRNRELPRLTLPPVKHVRGTQLSQHERLQHIRRALTDPAIPDIDKVVALLILLYAQPLIRIAMLTIDDVIGDRDEAFIRLGDPPTPVPAPFASVLITYRDNRLNLTTAANAGNRFLFPGRRTGQPLHTTSLRLRLRNLGLPNLDGRTAAVRHLLGQAPAPIVAEMLGYNAKIATQLAADMGAVWHRYAAGDHSRRG